MLLVFGKLGYHHHYKERRYRAFVAKMVDLCCLTFLINLDFRKERKGKNES